MILKIVVSLKKITKRRLSFNKNLAFLPTPILRLIRNESLMSSFILYSTLYVNVYRSKKQNDTFNMKYNYLVFLIFLLFAQNIQAQQSDEQAKILISEQAKSEVLGSLFQKLNDYYVFPEVAVKVENTLKHAKRKATI